MGSKRLLIVVFVLAQLLGVGVAQAKTVAAIGDISCGDASVGLGTGLGTPGFCRDERTAQLVQRRGVRTVLIPGDIQYEHGVYHEFLTYFDPVWGGFDLRPAPGNHEYRQPAAAGHFAYFGRRAGPTGRGYYSFDLAGWHVVSLNSNCEAVPCGASSAQAAWLRRDLRDASRCTLAFWHHPRFNSGHYGDLTRMGPLWRILEQRGGDVVLSGHDHLYERLGRLGSDGRRSAAGMRSFIVGTGGRSLHQFGTVRTGSELRYNRTFGVLFLDLRPRSYSWRYVNIADRTVDGGSDRCR